MATLTLCTLSTSQHFYLNIVNSYTLVGYLNQLIPLTKCPSLALELNAYDPHLVPPNHFPQQLRPTISLTPKAVPLVSLHQQQQLACFNDVHHPIHMSPPISPQNLNYWPIHHLPYAPTTSLILHVHYPPCVPHILHLILPKNLIATTLSNLLYPTFHHSMPPPISYSSIGSPSLHSMPHQITYSPSHSQRVCPCFSIHTSVLSLIHATQSTILSNFFITYLIYLTRVTLTCTLIQLTFHSIVYLPTNLHQLTLHRT